MHSPGWKETDNGNFSFLKCYHRTFQPPRLSAIISFVNTFVPIRKWLPIEANLGFLRAVDEMRRMTRKCVRQRIEDVEEAARKGEKFRSVDLGEVDRDLLTMIVEERRMFKGSEDELTEEEIVNQVRFYALLLAKNLANCSNKLLTFLAAGHETTAGAMGWATYILATQPRVQDKLRAEIVGLLQSNQGANPSWADIEKLHYVNNFCKEVLRMHCPALATYREAAADLTICNTFIPKGTIMYFMPAVSNLSKTIWGPDADEFVPERWDNLQGEAANPYAFETFLNGPRVCIGKHFAMMEFKVLLMEVVSKFRFGLSPELEALGGKLPPLQNPGLTLWPKGGLKVAVERI